MRLLVFSDSHGDTKTMARLIRKEQPDHILHLGDCVRDTLPLRELGIPITQVAGNCDPPGAAPEILVPELQGVTFYMTHGHRHGVKTHYQRAIYAALCEEAQVLLFGHTHRAECYMDQGLWILNPGACNASGSYGLILLENGQLQCRTQST